MNVLITGAAGFLGRRLTSAILARQHLVATDGSTQPIDQVRLLDVAPAPDPRDPRVQIAVGDLTDDNLLEGLIDTDTAAIFHFAAVVSGQAEADFDIGMRVNLDGTRRLLDVCRTRGHRPKVVFSSSVAVYGGNLPAVVDDNTRLTPQSSYGTEKAIVELLVADYTRKGFIDGRAPRLPTISVRAGKPNTALSSFASGIIREPLNGEPSVCPVGPDTVLWLLSPVAAIECLIKAHDISGDLLGHDRSLTLPGLAVSAAEMVAALARVAGPDVASLVRWELDPRVVRVASTWPGQFDASRALSLGFPTDETFDDVIRQYMEEQRRAS